MGNSQRKLPLTSGLSLSKAMMGVDWGAINTPPVSIQARVGFSSVSGLKRLDLSGPFNDPLLSLAKTAF